MDNTNTASTARAEFFAFCAEIGSTPVAEEEAILNVGREFLPPCALVVVDGGDPTDEYWTFLLAQTKEASDEQARTIAAGHDWSAEPTTVQCACGEWSGERCGHSAVDVADTVIVEYMPEQFRAGHGAARNRGSYPGNGAKRVRVATACADGMTEHDGDWCEIVEAS